MQKKEQEVLRMLSQYSRISFQQLCENFAITDKQLLTILSKLKNNGYCVQRFYQQCGDILLQLSSNELKKIMIDPKDKFFRFVAVADTHYGHPKSNIDDMSKVYQYCLQEDIHLIFHLGDVVEGVEHSNVTKFKSTPNQFQMVLKNYPSQERILNFWLFGNHDTWGLKTTKFNPVLFAADKRADIIPVAINRGCIYVQNELIALCHQAGVNSDSKIKLVLKGHSHTYRLKNDQNGCLVHVPTLSKINPMQAAVDIIPSFLDIQLEWYHQRFNTIDVKQIQLQENPSVINESKFPLLKKVKKSKEKK